MYMIKSNKNIGTFWIYPFIAGNPTEGIANERWEKMDLEKIHYQAGLGIEKIAQIFI